MVWFYLLGAVRVGEAAGQTMNCRVCGSALHTFSLLSPVCGEVGCQGDSLRQLVPLGTWPGLRCWACSEQCLCCEAGGCRASLASCLCRAACSAWLPLLQCGVRGLWKAWVQEQACPCCRQQGCCLPRFCYPQPGSLSWGFEHLLKHTGRAFGTRVP